MMTRNQTLLPLCVRRLGRVPYPSTWRRMRARIDTRNEQDSDELWLLEHNSVITKGVRNRSLDTPALDPPSGVDVIQTDRGGLITAHNPGQAVAYCLWNIQRLGVTAPQLVHRLEKCLQSCLAQLGIDAHTIEQQPGVYVGLDKIASIGLRLRRGWTYHGISVNVCNSLEIFDSFSPCGIDGLKTTSLARLGIDLDVDGFFTTLLDHLVDTFSFKLQPEPTQPRGADQTPDACRADVVRIGRHSR